MRELSEPSLHFLVFLLYLGQVIALFSPCTFGAHGTSEGQDGFVPNLLAILESLEERVGVVLGAREAQPVCHRNHEQRDQYEAREASRDCHKTT